MEVAYAQIQQHQGARDEKWPARGLEANTPSAAPAPEHEPSSGVPSSLLSSQSGLSLSDDGSCCASSDEDAAPAFGLCALAPARLAPADALDGVLFELLQDEEAAIEAAGKPPPTADAPPALAAADRANLVNWMASAAARLRLGDDALFYGVACLDALRLPASGREEVLVAAACLWVAAKWAHGAAAPPASAVAAALPSCGCGACAGCGAGGGGAAVRARLLAAEAAVLRALDYGARVLRRPTAEAFLTAALLRLQRCGAAHPGLAPLARLLSEEALLESQLLAYRPSAVAAGCLAYAAALLGAPLSEAALAHAAGVRGAAASDAASVLRAVHAAVAAAAAARNPYAASLRWLRRDAAVLRVAPIEGGDDPRLAALAPARAGGAWRWVLP
ncbi:hypothetical protein Rsub_09691 [Raphidocelis subcapitata]|uniref:Cyclin N-terminal domain-containing protein n=1 Tax=Raphidocelis subcapitata TaxID=307507 RepID=A0A2V0PID6_9CHLO|nr:hypothetical protein Rsub_09691 [Raphidocelis subcapitata]|eukprot:GBF96835.1 hypothetical protein Rsub_09691 [Raphidocelis subcapitata]